jgi:hypothetical protein
MAWLNKKCVTSVQKNIFLRYNIKSSQYPNTKFLYQIYLSYWKNTAMLIFLCNSRLPYNYSKSSLFCGRMLIYLYSEWCRTEDAGYNFWNKTLDIIDYCIETSWSIMLWLDKANHEISCKNINFWMLYLECLWSNPATCQNEVVVIYHCIYCLKQKNK